MASADLLYLSNPDQPPKCLSGIFLYQWSESRVTFWWKEALQGTCALANYSSPLLHSMGVNSRWVSPTQWSTHQVRLTKRNEIYNCLLPFPIRHPLNPPPLPRWCAAGIPGERQVIRQLGNELVDMLSNDTCVYILRAMWSHQSGCMSSGGGRKLEHRGNDNRHKGELSTTPPPVPPARPTGELEPNLQLICTDGPENSCCLTCDIFPTYIQRNINGILSY